MLDKEKRDYEGFITRPMSWKSEVDKFQKLSAPFADANIRDAIITTVARMEDLRVRDLTKMLELILVDKAKL